jgi:hypothetical protein
MINKDFSLPSRKAPAIHARQIMGRLNQSKPRLKSSMFVFTFCLLCASLNSVKAQGNYVFSGAEAANHGSIALTTGSAVWSTQRAATPGYFSLVGTATFTGATTGSTALIDGYVKHYATAANQGATFPVGAGTTLRTVTTSGSIPSGMQVATAWIPGDPSGNLDPTKTGAAGGAHSVNSRGAGISAVSTAGQWDWQDLSSTAGGINVSVITPDLTGFASPSLLRLVGWNGTQWINLSGTQGSSAANGNSEGSALQGTLQAGLSAIGIGRVSIIVNVKVFLQGAYNASTGLMTTTLRTNGLLPLSQPYNIAPWSYAGTETVANLAAIPSTVTDWILVELRNSSNVVVDRRAAFLKSDGTIVDLDGTSPLSFINQPEGTYHLAIRHRNHLTIRTSAVQLISPSSTQYDFTTTLSQAYQNFSITSNTPTRQITGTVPAFVMWAGDGNANGTVSYLGINNDYSVITSALSGSLSGNLTNVYHRADFNMNGVVSALGINNDLNYLTGSVRSGVLSSAGNKLAHQ